MTRRTLDNLKSFTRGGQITLSNVRMFNQIYTNLIKGCLFGALILTLLLILWRGGLSEILNALNVYLARVLVTLHMPDGLVRIVRDGTVFHLPAFYVNSGAWFQAQGRILLISAITSFIFSAVVFTIIFALCIWWLRKRGEKQTEARHVRGAKLMDAKAVAKLISKSGNASRVTIDGLPLPKNFEVQHLLLHGTTGAGKGQTLEKILDVLRANGKPAIIYDKGGVFTAKYHREGDQILNAQDSRCENYCLWDECESAADFENLAESLIPMHAEVDPFWVNGARTIFANTARKMAEDKDRSIDKLLKVLLTLELDELKNYVQGTEAASLTSDKIEKTAISIRSILTTYVKSLRFLRGIEEGGKSVFSMRRWVQETAKGEKNNWLFITSDGKQHAAVKPLISMWIAMASIELLGLKEDYDRRIFFVLDELPSLHRLPSLPTTIAEARKFGGCFIIGMQSLAQMKQVYGQSDAAAIFDLLNTRFYYRSPSAEMAQLVSRELGEEEIEVVKESYSYGANTIRDGISIGNQTERRFIVSYTEIMQLKNLDCFLRVPGYPVARIHLIEKHRPTISEGRVPRDVPIDPLLEESIEKHEKPLKSELNADVQKQLFVDDTDVFAAPGVVSKSPDLNDEHNIAADSSKRTLKEIGKIEIGI